MCVINDVECNSVGEELKQTLSKNTEPPSLPILSVAPNVCDDSEDKVSSKPLRLPSLKRRPTFALVRQNSESEDVLENIQHEEHGVKSTNEGEYKDSDKIQETSIKATKIIQDIEFVYEDDTQEGACPICLDNYGKAHSFFKFDFCELINSRNLF